MVHYTKELLRLIRPHQWIKNGFVFAGVLFGHAWTSLKYVEGAVLAAVAFSLVSSGVYILNDLRDAPSDRLHPRKKHRPIASGTIPMGLAVTIMLVLFVVGGSIGFYVSPMVLIILASYLVMNIFYSLGLKHVVILDVFIISLGFMLRLLAGTYGIGIQPSQWLLVCGLMVTLFLGFCKRRAELFIQAEGAAARRVLEHYSPLLLDIMIGVTLACVLMSYSLYTIDERTQLIHGTTHLVLTIPFVVYATFRYMYLMYSHGGGEDAARDLVRDPHILVTVLIWAIVVLVVFSLAGEAPIHTDLLELDMK